MVRKSKAVLREENIRERLVALGSVSLIFFGLDKLEALVRWASHKPLGERDLDALEAACDRAEECLETLRRSDGAWFLQKINDKESA